MKSNFEYSTSHWYIGNAQLMTGVIFGGLMVIVSLLMVFNVGLDVVSFFIGAVGAGLFWFGLQGVRKKAVYSFTDAGVSAKNILTGSWEVSWGNIASYEVTKLSQFSFVKLNQIFQSQPQKPTVIYIGAKDVEKIDEIIEFVGEHIKKETKQSQLPATKEHKVESFSSGDIVKGRIAQLQVVCKHCEKTTNIYVEESSASSTNVKCEHCKKVFEFSAGMLYKPVGYVSEIPQWAVIEERKD